MENIFQRNIRKRKELKEMSINEVEDLIDSLGMSDMETIDDIVEELNYREDKEIKDSMRG